MIPKVIHFCWLSEDPYPPLINDCLNSWREHLPGYEIVKWDLNMFDVNSVEWVRRAYESKKYAFACDYIRLYALYHYGGIYLDTDVEVLRSFDDLLERHYFVGEESDGIIEPAVMGSVKGNKWMKLVMEKLETMSFPERLDEGIISLPRLMMSVIEPRFSFKGAPDIPDIGQIIKSELDTTIFIYPRDYFCCKSGETGRILVSKNSYTIHHFSGSWLPKTTWLRSRVKYFLIRWFGENLILSIVVFLKGTSKDR